MIAAWGTWVRFWSETEHPRTLAIVRMLLGATICFDFLEIWRLDLVTALFAPNTAGGLADLTNRASLPAFYVALPATAGTARLLHGVILASAVSFTLGFFTRTSAAALLLAWAQFADVLPAADRGIDTLCRDVLMLFAVAPGGAWGSLDAAIRTGSPAGDGAPIGAWPRRLLVLQIVAMYWLAGIQKVGVHWWPPGHFAALYFVLLDPAIARFDFSFLPAEPFFRFTQLGTVVTLVFQDTYPVVLLIRYLRFTPERGGRVRAWLARVPWIEWPWIAVGALFHLILAFTAELGIFPWAMLALYPAWVHPDRWPWVRRAAPSPSAPRPDPAPPAPGGAPPEHSPG